MTVRGAQHFPWGFLVRGSRLPSAVLLSLAVVTASAAMAMPAPPSVATEPLTPPNLHLLVEAAGNHRLVEGRLVGGFSWGPWEGEGARLPSEPVFLERFATAVRTIERGARTDTGAEPRHALGVLRLAQRRRDEAVELLEEAARTATGDDRRAAILSDLAAAHLARERAEGRPAELIAALTAAAAALRLDPTLAEAQFNSALARSRLHLPQAALKAWEAYLGLDAASPWAGEAKRHLESLAAPTLRSRWEQLEGSLLEAALAQDGVAMTEITGELPLFVRGHGENVALPAWGDAVIAGDREEASRRLRTARSIAEALIAAGLDHSVADALASIDHAAQNPASDPLGILARGHAAYGRGYRIERGLAEGSACEAYRRASEALSPAGSAFAPWAAFSEVIACTYQKDNDGAHRALTSLAAEVSAERNPALAGRIEWMLLLTEMRRGRFEAAYRHGQGALELLRRAQDFDAVSAEVRLAFLAQTLGLEDEAWDHRLRALAGFAAFGHAEGLHGALDEIAGMLLDAGRTAAAWVFVEELVANAEGLTPAHRAYAVAERARWAALTGDADAARLELARAESEAARLPEGDVRRRVEEDLTFARGRIELRTDPRAAAATLTAALTAYAASGDRFQTPRLHLLRARARIALGLPEEAEQDFEEAFRRIEARRASATAEHHRVSFFETFQSTADELTAFFAFERDDPARAFAYTEAARGRALLDGVRRSPSPTAKELDLDAGYPAAARLEDLEGKLPAGLALVEYAVLERRVLAWICRRGSCRLRELPGSSAELEARVRRFDAALERGASLAELRGPAEDLYAVLIAPLAADLAEVEGLVVVPDRFLHLLPFAALRDAEADAYLIEHWSLRIAPSASVFLRALERARPPVERRGVLAVAAPELATGPFAGLEDLPLASEEARRVRDLYPRGETLLGAEANKIRLLEEVKRFPVLHVATHALHRPGAPLLSALLLSDLDEPGSGALRAAEIYAHDWTGVEVVVLSACRTAGSVSGSGREGPAGLLRAFLAAGVPRVVASIRDVPDRAALAFMVELHKNLAAGADPAEALQAAQLEMLRHEEEQFRSPAVWANFQLYGP